MLEVLKKEKDKDMIDRDNVRGLKYLIIVGSILAFMILVCSSETFAQLSTFSGSGGYGYPGSFYGGYPGYGYHYGGYGDYSMPYGYAGYSRYDYPESSYGGYTGYGYPGSFYSAYPYIGDSNYSRYVSLGGFFVPREFFELSASSNWNTAQLGYALIKPYFQSAVMSRYIYPGPSSIPYYAGPPVFRATPPKGNPLDSDKIFW